MTTCHARPDETKAASYRWLTAALVGLALLVGWYGIGGLWERQNYARAGLLGLCLIAYCAHGSLYRVHEFFQAREYRGYFGISFVVTASALWLAAGKGPTWLLCLPVFSQAILILPRSKIVPIAIALFVLSFYPLWANLGRQAFQAFMNFFFTGIFSWVLRRERDHREALHAAHEKLREYSANAEALAAAEERARLAREIHDGVAHHLTSANVLVAAGLAQLPGEMAAGARDSLQKAQGQIRAALGEIRQSITERSSAAPAEPLAQRIEALIAAGNFPASFSVTGTPRRLTPEAELGLYRVAQEALTNASKHAPGEALTVQLAFAGPTATTLRIENPEPAQSASGDGAFGLLSLRERMTKLGGRFTAGPTPNGRFAVEAQVPA